MLAGDVTLLAGVGVWVPLTELPIPDTADGIAPCELDRGLTPVEAVEGFKMEDATSVSVAAGFGEVAFPKSASSASLCAAV